MTQGELTHKWQIQINNLRKIYETPEWQVHALENSSLTIDDGEFVCLVGLSGCGETALLNMQSRPASGHSSGDLPELWP